MARFSPSWRSWWTPSTAAIPTCVWRITDFRHKSAIRHTQVVAAFADDTHALPVDARLNVYATCDGGDVVGTHLCFAVKEGIITSVGLQLVDDRTPRTGIAVHLVSVDASPPGLPKGATSAVSVTYALFGGPIEYYDGAQVFLVDAKKVSDINNPCRKSRRPNSKTEGSNRYRRFESTPLRQRVGANRYR
jgi:hypothetical protein